MAPVGHSFNTTTTMAYRLNIASNGSYRAVPSPQVCRGLRVCLSPAKASMLGRCIEARSGAGCTACPTRRRDPTAWQISMSCAKGSSNGMSNGGWLRNFYFAMREDNIPAHWRLPVPPSRACLRSLVPAPLTAAQVPLCENWCLPHSALESGGLCCLYPTCRQDGTQPSHAWQVRSLR